MPNEKEMKIRSTGLKQLRWAANNFSNIADIGVTLHTLANYIDLSSSGSVSGTEFSKITIERLRKLVDWIEADG